MLEIPTSMLTGGNFFIVMGDDNSWSKAAVFIAFIIIDFIFFSFGSAIQNSNSTNLEKNMEAGELKAEDPRGTTSRQL